MFQNINFKDVFVRIDGERFLDCNFENCVFEYSGEMSGPISFERCKIVNHQYKLVGAAGNTMRFLESAYHSMGDRGEQFVNMTFEDIKNGRHTVSDVENTKKILEEKHVFSVFCSLMHLSTAPDVNVSLAPNPIFLSRNVAYVNTWRQQHPDVEKFFGKLYLDALARNPFFHCRIELSHDESTKMKVASASNIESYFNALWLVKDHSVNIDRLFLEGPELHTSLTGAQRYCTSSGEYGDTAFTNAELLTGLDFNNKLNKINAEMISSAATLPGFDPSFKSGITSATINETNYDDFNRITRAWLFLESARAETHLPPKVAFFIASLEALFSTSSKFVSANVCNRAAKYVAGDQREFDRVLLFLKDEMYELRSRYIHGDRLGTLNTSSVLTPKVVELDTIMRRILVKVINDDATLFIDDVKAKPYLESLYLKR